MTVEGYLARLGVPVHDEPSAEALAELHARHLELVPYENFEIQLGRPTPVDGAAAAAHIVRGGGGYCFHLNGAFGMLLDALGYRVSRHRGTVQNSLEVEPGTHLNHLVLHVHDLPGPGNPEGSWWADVGLGGDGFTRPLPLRAGRYQDAPYAFVLDPSPVYEDGWRVVQAPTGSWAVADADRAAPPPAEVEASHARLSTSPDSGFLTTLSAQRHDAADGVDVLRACTLTRIDGAGTTRATIDREDDWFAVLADLFGLSFDAADRRVLWPRAQAQHAAWMARRAS